MHRLDRVRLSIRAQNQLGKIKHGTSLPINVLARFGIVLSLGDPSIPNPDMYDEKGTELLPHTLYGKNERMYAAMLQYRLRQDGLDYSKYADRMIRAHVNRGAGMLFPRVRQLEDFGRLLEAAA